MGGDALHRVLQSLSTAQQPYLKSCLEGDLLSVSELAEQLDEYRVTLEQRRASHEFIDLETARVLDKRCRGLISRLGAAATEDQRRLLQGAVLYFVLEDDAESDSESIVGFDDDRDVIEAVEKELDGGSL